jgi:abhydrolase domain-containing protein 6
VASLALFDPAGVEAPELSDAHRLLKETGENPFVIEDRADVDRFFGLLFVEQPFAPSARARPLRR